MTVFVKPSAWLDLSHRASLIADAAVSDFLVVASEEGAVTLVGPDHLKRTTFNRPEKITGVSVHPFEPLLAFVEGEEYQLTITDANGLRLHEFFPSKVNELSVFFRRGGDCFFELDGRHLWYAVALYSDEIEIRRIECHTWSVVAETILEDPYGESGIEFHCSGMAEKTALWLAAGQDGQQIYWLTENDGKIACEPDPRLEDTTPPHFSPSGREFLVRSGETSLSKYQFPDVRLEAECQWFDDDSEEAFGYLLCYIIEKWALVSYSQGRLFLLNLTEMVISEEVELEGHESQPVHVYHPTLADDDSLCTDITYFQRFGDTIVFVFRRDQGIGLTPWEDTLLFLPITALTSGRE